MATTESAASASDFASTGTPGDYCFPTLLESSSSGGRGRGGGGNRDEESTIMESLLAPYREEAEAFNINSSNSNDENHGDCSERLLFHDDENADDIGAGHGSTTVRHRNGGNRGGRQYGGAIESFFQINSRNHLNGLNLLNVLSYGLHLFVIVGIGIFGLDNIVYTWQGMTNKYETLLTPSEWAVYAFWYPILVLEGVFCVAQLFSYYRARPIVQSGTGFFFFHTTLFQTAWILFFCFELFIPSFLSLAGALVALFSLLNSQEQQLVGSTGRRITEYIFFRLPFYWQTGWMVVLTVHHFSLLFRAYNCPTFFQLGVDIFSLGILAVVALLFTFQGKDLVVPIVILTSFIAISTRLEHPSQTLINILVDGEVLIMDALRVACYFYTGTITCCIIPVLVIWISREFCTIQVVELVNE